MYKTPRLRCLVAERQLRKLIRLNYVRKHGGKALRIVDLELHVVVALEDREVIPGPSFHTGIPEIDNDWALQALNDQISELRTSCCGLDSHDQPCWLHIQAIPMRSLRPFGRSACD